MVGLATELGDRLAAATDRPIQGPLYGALGFDPATGRATARALAAMPMARLRDLTLAVVREQGGDPAAAAAAVDAAWHAPTR